MNRRANELAATSQASTIGRATVASLIAIGALSACAGDDATGDTAAPTVATPASLTSDGAPAPPNFDPATRFYVPPPNPAAITQAVTLLHQRWWLDAARIAALATTPHAVWFTGGSPDEVRTAVHETMRKAGLEHRVPVLVAYNLPYRDCAQYSGGGATDSAAYEAWIDAFAEGIGDGKALVMVEPDGLGIIPHNTTIFGAADWCRPTVPDASGTPVPAPGATPSDRYAQLNYAVDELASRAANASVYLDGTHAAWLGVGEAAYRLARAGVARARGFFLNVSNFELTADNTQFGTWVSQCITAATAGPTWAAGHFDWCPSQYNAATGFSVDYSEAYAATVTAGLAGLLDGAQPTTRFVIDTGRNGLGHWVPNPLANYPDPQVWCNPPQRGAGLRPSASTGNALVDAYLWIKVPGESDGSCNRGIASGVVDPEWGGTLDPAAGTWFPKQALELAKLSVPPLF